MSVSRNEVMNTKVLLEGWSRVIRVEYRQQCSNGDSQLHDRDLLDRGDGITVLLYNREKGKVLLVRQPRIVATLRTHGNGETIEACNGLVQNEDPYDCALREVEEELGHKVQTLKQVASVYASPGGSLEMIHIFLGEYTSQTRVGTGGGLSHEGEDIEVLEVPFEEAMRWIQNGAICDGRTILALQFLALSMKPYEA